MQKEASQKFLFIINPVSGGHSKVAWENAIRTYFEKIPEYAEFYLLSGSNDKPSIAHYIKTIQPCKVIAVGGDGTIKLVAEMVRETSITMGILPAGSANGLAKELQIPADIAQALDVVMHGAVKVIDTIRINEEEICLHLSDLGLNALLIKTFESSKLRGMWGYTVAVFKAFWKRTKIRVTIETDTETVRRKAFMVVIANASKYGTGATINPGSSIADGYFEAVVVRKLSMLMLLKMLITHQTFNSDHIEIFKTKTLHITTLHRTYFQVDGEYRGKVKDIKARIMPAALKVMVPQPQETMKGGGLA